MTHISKLKDVQSVDEALTILMAHPNSLDYKKKFNSQFEEERDLAFELCGVASKSLAMDFMKGFPLSSNAFFNNVSYNNDSSIPLVMRAIDISLENRATLETESEQAAMELSQYLEE